MIKPRDFSKFLKFRFKELCIRKINQPIVEPIDFEDNNFGHFLDLFGQNCTRKKIDRNLVGYLYKLKQIKQVMGLIRQLTTSHVNLSEITAY